MTGRTHHTGWRWQAALMAILAAGVPAMASTPGATTRELVGEVKLQPPAPGDGAAGQVGVALLHPGGEQRLAGALLDELRRLQGMRVVVVGLAVAGEGALRVAKYQILDVGGGVRPLVGILVRAGDDLLLSDGEGQGIRLSLPPRSRGRLLAKVGAKVWVHGKTLLTGELGVAGFGILREPAPPR